MAWLSLDEADRRSGQFWTYVITALQSVVPGVGAGVLPLLQAAQQPIETVLATVINELSAAPGEIHLVLDDYHLVDGPDVEAGMVFLLEHLPPHVHLVISTRADPALPLARLRARGDLVEVRALLGTLMYRSRLVPRLIPTIGLVGGILLLADVTVIFFGGYDIGSVWHGIAAAPIFVWELSLGVWLVVKGFSASPITARIAADHRGA